MFFSLLLLRSVSVSIGRFWGFCNSSVHGLVQFGSAIGLCDCWLMQSEVNYESCYENDTMFMAFVLFFSSFLLAANRL